MRKQTSLWTMKNGTKIRVCDMADSHLKNAEAMVARNYRAKCSVEASQALAYAFAPMTPDGASMAAEREGDLLLEEAEVQEYIADWCAAYPALVEELHRRGLKTKAEEEVANES